jgi:hypothetical protein
MKNLYSLYYSLAVWVAYIGGVLAQNEDEVDEFQARPGSYGAPGYPPGAYGSSGYVPGAYGPPDYPSEAYGAPPVSDKGICVSFWTSIRNRRRTNFAQCPLIQAALPGKVIYPSSPDYDGEKRSYWSLEASDVSPACFVRPTSAAEVSQIIQILNKPRYDYVPSCQFAIRSGGRVSRITFVGRSNDQIDIKLGVEPLPFREELQSIFQISNKSQSTRKIMWCLLGRGFVGKMFMMP